MKIAIIGGGTMGQCLAQSFLSQALVTANELYLVEKDSQLAANLKQKFSAVRTEVGPEISACEVVILAVKPQDAKLACQELGANLKSQALVISIMAGVSLAKLKTWLNYEKLVRCMPNLAVKVGHSMTVYVAANAVDPAGIATAEKIFSSFGAALRINREELMDAVTAISGTGPGLIFFFIEQMLAAAQKLGFSAKEAELLAKETLKGSAALWSACSDSPASLRAKVTSKGGTTAAAMEVLEQGGAPKLIEQAFLRACQRSAELGKE